MLECDNVPLPYFGILISMLHKADLVQVFYSYLLLFFLNFRLISKLRCLINRLFLYLRWLRSSKITIRLWDKHPKFELGPFAKRRLDSYVSPKFLTNLLAD